MDNLAPTYQALFERTESLWQDIRILAEKELLSTVDNSGHDILMDIAKDSPIEWDDSLRRLSKALFHQAEVVCALDELRYEAKKEE